jgi:hypothetical protein
LSTQSPPSRLAVVRMPATSEPAPGSVMPTAGDQLAGDHAAQVLVFCAALPA